MTKITEQEALNRIGAELGLTQLSVTPFKAVVPSTTNENIGAFGADLGKKFYANITGAGLPKQSEGCILQTDSGLQLFPNEDGSVAEQRVMFGTLDAFYETGVVVIEGFEYTPASN